MAESLRWEKQEGNSEWAYSGDICIGMIGTLTDEPDVWWYTAHNAVSMKYIAKGSGHVASRATARLAVDRAWLTWLEQANLRPR